MCEELPSKYKKRLLAKTANVGDVMVWDGSKWVVGPQTGDGLDLNDVNDLIETGFTSYLNNFIADDLSVNYVTNTSMVDTIGLALQPYSTIDNVDTSISNALTGYATQIYTNSQISAALLSYSTTGQMTAALAALKAEIYGGAPPGALDSIAELAAAINNDENIVTNLTNLVGTKASTTYVDGALADKASIVYVDGQIATRATTSYVNTQLALKADASLLSAYATLAGNNAMTGANTFSGQNKFTDKLVINANVAALAALHVRASAAGDAFRAEKLDGSNFVSVDVNGRVLTITEGGSATILSLIGGNTSFTNAANNTFLIQSGAGSLRAGIVLTASGVDLTTNATSRLRVDNSGNVNIAKNLLLGSVTAPTVMMKANSAIVQVRTPADDAFGTVQAKIQFADNVTMEALTSNCTMPGLDKDGNAIKILAYKAG
ncbi:MAG: hypothetical protein V4538_02325 [Bacteroidota bacterium]